MTFLLEYHKICHVLILGVFGWRGNKWNISSRICLKHIKLRFKYFFVLIFVVFVDGPHIDRMFKIVLIFTQSLKWSLFSQFVFYLVFSVTLFKSLTEHCTGDTVCIRVCYVYCTCVQWRILTNNFGKPIYYIQNSKFIYLISVTNTIKIKMNK